MTDARSSLLPRLEAAADRNRSITFVNRRHGQRGLHHRSGGMVPDPRRRPGDGRRAPGPRHRARPLHRADRPDEPRPRHRDPGGVAHRRVRRDAAAADAHGLHRGVHRADPRAHVERGVPARHRRCAAARVPHAGADRPADGHARRAARRGRDARRRRVLASRRPIPTRSRSCSSRVGAPRSPRA